MAVLATWAFTGGVLSATSAAANLAAGAIANNGFGSFAASVAFTYASEPVLWIEPAVAAADAAAAVAAGDYFDVTVTADEGYALNLAGLDFNAARGGNDAPRGWVLRSSADGYAADIDSADVPTVRPTWTAESVDLSGAAFQGLGAITFRVYVYTPATNRSIEFDDFVLNGTVDATGGAVHEHSTAQGAPAPALALAAAASFAASQVAGAPGLGDGATAAADFGASLAGAGAAPAFALDDTLIAGGGETYDQATSHGAPAPAFALAAGVAPFAWAAAGAAGGSWDTAAAAAADWTDLDNETTDWTDL